jgi:hypothetical protein
VQDGGSYHGDEWTTRGNGIMRMEFIGNNLIIGNIFLAFLYFI